MLTIFANLIRGLKLSPQKQKLADKHPGTTFWDLPSHSFYSALLTSASEDIFLSPAYDSYVSFFKQGSLAIVPLQQSVTLNPYLLLAFENECLRLGLQSLYIGVGKSDLAFFSTINKQCRLTGYEGFANVQLSELNWAIEALNLANEHNLSVHVYESPILDGLVQQLEAVVGNGNTMQRSARYTDSVSCRQEITRKLKFSTIAVLENSEGKIFAFAKLGVNPAGETGSFGSISQTFDAPANAQHLLIAGIIHHYYRQGRSQISLGSISATLSKSSAEKTLNQYVHEWHPHYAAFSKSLNPNQVIQSLMSL
ncbi:hypothetical protein BN8_04749 [Fibrisoma limi BUZ 3]|uniref:BioF2-like acetyltransferase domain-containing protein n=1 Tax=Fibrisoma limi BUZ 3 TaxID=1185876 RepID=I2GNL2_9BACT|nr:hypothetical protein [Fibrisoma limi]CCH55490.1 hypothetical protein BN8_04749 [Fibrisoma limi BUZ 3]